MEEDEEFARMWEEEIMGDEVHNKGPTAEELDERTSEYLIRDAHARWKLFSTMMGVYFFARWGESMADLHFDETHREIDIQFQLANSEK